MFELFQNENVAQGLPVKGQFQAGVSDFDPGTIVEKGILLPWNNDPEVTWVYYECRLECYLDSGIVVHNFLPTDAPTADTLASCNVFDSSMNKIIKKGVNLISNDSYTDVAQRMAHSRYWFRLAGQALRIGFEIPIPSLKTVAGVTAIPYDNTPQSAWNYVAKNYSGVPLFHAVWSLWYTVTEPPTSQQLPPPNLAAYITADAPLPQGYQAPLSVPDGNAQTTQPNAAQGLLNATQG